MPVLLTAATEYVPPLTKPANTTIVTDFVYAENSRAARPDAEGWQKGAGHALHSSPMG